MARSVFSVLCVLALLACASAGFNRYNCFIMNANFNDPIVFPDQEGVAHHHTFWGNTDLSFDTITATGSNLIEARGSSTCGGGGDDSVAANLVGGRIINRCAYWVAGMYDANNEIVLSSFGGVERQVQMRYDKATDADCFPFPSGLTMIAGTASTSSVALVDTDYTWYVCSGDATKYGQIPDFCTGHLTQMIVFPNCWDGNEVNWFDATPNGGNMAYSVDRVCPDSHPFPIPQITYKLEYVIPGTTKNWYLASDRYDEWCDNEGGYSIHADFMNGWEATVLKELTDCINDEPDTTSCFLEISPALVQSQDIFGSNGKDNSLVTPVTAPKCSCAENADLSQCDAMTIATNSVTAADLASSSGSDTAAIVGGVVGGIAALALVLGAVFFCYRTDRCCWAEKQPQPAVLLGASSSSSSSFQFPIKAENTSATSNMVGPNGIVWPSNRAANKSRLPKGWTEEVDETSGNKYYYNPSTQQTTWDFPTR